MDGHCNCCEENRKIVEDLKVANRAYREDAKDAEKKCDDLNQELTAAQNAADDAEEARDAADDKKEDAFYALRLEKDKALVLLRRLEFNLAVCPICTGHLEHKTGCDLKLAIWHLDHELNRTEYVHL